MDNQIVMPDAIIFDTCSIRKLYTQHQKDIGFFKDLACQGINVVVADIVLEEVKFQINKGKNHKCPLTAKEVKFLSKFMDLVVSRKAFDVIKPNEGKIAVRSFIEKFKLESKDRNTLNDRLFELTAVNYAAENNIKLMMVTNDRFVGMDLYKLVNTLNINEGQIIRKDNEGLLEFCSKIGI